MVYTVLGVGYHSLGVVYTVLGVGYHAYDNLSYPASATHNPYNHTYV